MSTLQDFHDEFTGLENFRAKRPLFNELPDEDTVEMLRQHYARDLSPEEFNRAIGYVPPPAPAAERTQAQLAREKSAVLQPDNRDFVDMAIDTGRNVVAGALKIGPTAVKGAADLANMATGDWVDIGLSKTMERGMESIDEVVGSKRLNEQKKALKAIMADDSKGMGDMLVFMLDNPSILVDNTITGVGSAILSGGMAKGVTSGATMLGMSVSPKLKTVATIGASAAQNAAKTFMALEDRSLEDRYKGAIFAAGVSILGSIALGGGAEGKMAEKMAGDLKAGRIGLDAVKKFLLSVGKGGAQGAVDEVGNIAGEIVGAAKDLNPADVGKRMASASVSGAAAGGVKDVTGIEDKIQQYGIKAQEAPAPVLRRRDGGAVVPARAGNGANRRGGRSRQPAMRADADAIGVDPIGALPLLAGIEVVHTPAGNIIVTGENAAEVVKAIAPDAPTLRRKDGAVMVSLRYSEPVSQAIGVAKRLLGGRSGDAGGLAAYPSR